MMTDMEIAFDALSCESINDYFHPSALTTTATEVRKAERANLATVSKRNGSSGDNQGKKSSGQAESAPLIPYVGPQSDEGEFDPNELDQATRMRIKEQAGN